MTFDSIPQHLPPQSLSRPTRYLAGIFGGIFVGAFLHEAVGHPADGWPSAILFGLPMIWLIQGARTGSSQNWGSVVWYSVWYVIFASCWLIALAFEHTAAGSSLSPQAGLGGFLGSIVRVGGASGLAHRSAAAGAPRQSAAQVSTRR